jgi:hypothetical protein
MFNKALLYVDAVYNYSNPERGINRKRQKGIWQNWVFAKPARIINGKRQKGKGHKRKGNVYKKKSVTRVREDWELSQFSRTVLKWHQSQTARIIYIYLFIQHQINLEITSPEQHLVGAEIFNVPHYALELPRVPKLGHVGPGKHVCKYVFISEHLF